MKLHITVEFSADEIQTIAETVQLWFVGTENRAAAFQTLLNEARRRAKVRVVK
jgi:hypothetical protein